jgi:hypothetical protein
VVAKPQFRCWLFSLFLAPIFAAGIRHFSWRDQQNISRKLAVRWLFCWLFRAVPTAGLGHSERKITCIVARGCHHVKM